MASKLTTLEEKVTAIAYSIIFGVVSETVCKCPNFIKCSMKPFLTAKQMEELEAMAEKGYGTPSVGLENGLKKYANANGGLFIHSFRWTREEALEAARMYEKIEQEYYELARQSPDRRDYFLNCSLGASKIAGDLKEYAKWLT